MNQIVQQENRMPAVSKIEKLSQQLASRLNLGVDGRELVETLKETAFRGQVSDSQMAALLIVAEQYGLNPWTKEIYAFPDKQNGIVPVVGVDGWSRIINSHPQFNGMEFKYSDSMTTPTGGASPAHDWVECVVYRKDRDHPIVVREYLDEVYRAPFQGKGQNGAYTVNGPWQTHTKRMHRHKSMIQASRIAFGFVGIYDEDEAERIVQKQPEKEINPVQSAPAEKPFISNAGLNASMAKIKTGELTIQRLRENRQFTPEQSAKIDEWVAGAEWVDMEVTQ